MFISSPLFTRLDYFRLSNMEDELADLGQTALPADLLALGAGLAPGEEATKVYTLRDYWALFPLSMWLPYSNQNYQELDALAQRTFPIPVPEDLTAEATVTMRRDGSLEVSFFPSVHGLWPVGTHRRRGAGGRGLPGVQPGQTEPALDYSHFPDGYGIYVYPSTRKPATIRPGWRTSSLWISARWRPPLWKKARCRDSCCFSHWKRDSSISR